MIVFELKGVAKESAHDIINRMNIGIGEYMMEYLSNNQTVVFINDKFKAIFVESDEPGVGDIEVYGLKNTNSVLYYTKRYPILNQLIPHVIRTKRW